MAIVRVIDNGPGKGKDYIDDRFVVKTKEEVEQILENCVRIAEEDYLRQRIKALQNAQND